MLGIALGVAALIIVLSVMNGFQKEVRDRMLAVVSHIELLAPGGEGFADVNALIAQAKQNTEVMAAAPFVSQQALMARGEDMRGAMVRGIDPEPETQVSDFTLQIPPAVRATLQVRQFQCGVGWRAGHVHGRARGRSNHPHCARRTSHTSGCDAALETVACVGHF